MILTNLRILIKVTQSLKTETLNVVASPRWRCVASSFSSLIQNFAYSNCKTPKKDDKCENKDQDVMKKNTTTPGCCCTITSLTKGSSNTKTA